MIYHLRMIGRYRLRVAVGGINLGIGIFVAMLICLVEAGFVSLVLSPMFFYGLILICAVSLLAGVLNITASMGKIF